MKQYTRWKHSYKKRSQRTPTSAGKVYTHNTNQQQQKQHKYKQLNTCLLSSGGMLQNGSCGQRAGHENVRHDL